MDDDQYLGQIMLIAGPFAPRGYAECNGQLLQISENTQLFRLLDKRYGGDGVRTFGLPDLRGRIACGPGTTLGLGNTTGTERNAMSINNMPAHAHTATAKVGLGASSTDDQSSNSPIDSYLRAQSSNTYSSTQNATMGKTTATVVLGNQGSATPMPNIMPSLPMIFCISLTGPFPPPE